MVNLLRQHCGVDFSLYKTSTLSRRVRQRITQSDAPTAQAYLQRIGEDEGERKLLCNDLLINVTEFFRDPPVFAQLADEVFPDLLRGRDAAHELRIWSVGCATGEEAYSLAMLALDAAGRMGFAGNVKVFATDLASDALARASRGAYSAESVAAVPEALLRRYFQREPDGGARVDPTLRRHVVFARHNLLSDPPFTRVDLAVCRNLLIYLQPSAQIKALSQLHFALKPHGLLLLGASETAGDFEAHAFSVVDRSNKLFRKQAVTLLRAPDLPTASAQVVPTPAEPPSPVATGQAPEVLAAELTATRERLHEMVLELQASHERVDLSNEELTASNEELQSTNEELKSVNEDLYTLNRELAGKNDELAALNQDYDHLLASTEIGTVFLDAELRLRRFSPNVDDFLGLRAPDIGRPVAEIRYRLGSQETFMDNLRRCAREGARIEHEAMLPDGRWVFERMLPFKETHDGGSGVVLTWTDISKVKHIQTHAEQLAADRSRLLGILDALPAGVYIASAEHDIEYLNPVLEREFGPVKGRKCFEYFHGGHAQCGWCKNPEVLAGQTVHWEWTSQKGRTFDLFDMPFQNPDGTVSKLEILHDITDIKDSKLRMKEAAQLAHVGHWEWQVASGELRWSEETFGCFGYAADSIQPSFELFVRHIDSNDRAMVQAAVQRALEQGTDYRAEFRFHRVDGSARIGRATGHVERDAEGTPLTMSGAMQDITELRQTEQRFRVAFRASPLAASIARRDDGVFVEANERFKDILGWSSSEMIGRSAQALGFWPTSQAREAWIAEMDKSGTLFDYETTLLDRDGAARQISFSSELIDLDGVTHILAYMQDITERKETEARIEFLAHHDPLTRLPNRLLFNARLTHSLSRSIRARTPIAVLMVDLDGFKLINDQYGHAAGDQVLEIVGSRLATHIRGEDTVARLGGDEFAIVLEDLESEDIATEIARKLIQAISPPIELMGAMVSVTASIGIAFSTPSENSPGKLLRSADEALYLAKNAGKNTCRIFARSQPLESHA